MQTHIILRRRPRVAPGQQQRRSTDQPAWLAAVAIPFDELATQDTSGRR